MSERPVRWHVADRLALERRLHDEIARLATEAMAARAAFSIVLAGGSTPMALYASLVDLPASGWANWHVYFSDERCLPSGDPGRNDTMARERFLDRVAIPRRQINPIPAERGPTAGALAYCTTLRETGPFDLVLLGLGEDGHTASLFPGQPLGTEPSSPDAIAVHDAPKPPPERVSLSAARLSRAAAVFVLVTGAGKRDAVRALRTGAATPLDAIRPPKGLDLFVDETSTR